MNRATVGNTPRLRVVDGDDAVSGEGTLIHRYSAFMRLRHLSDETIKRRTKTLRQLRRFVDPTPLCHATADDLEQFLGSKIAARTKHAYRSDLRMFYAWLNDRGVIAESPAAKLPSVKVPKGLPRPIPVDEALGTLLHGSVRVRRMVALALYAGLRCKEIAQLRAEDIWLHAEPPVIVVRDGKGSKDRVVPMHPELIALFRSMPSSGAVFAGRSGEPIQAQSVSTAIRDHLRRSDVLATPHQYRHTFGTAIARASGGDMVLTATLMGHESMNTTMNYVRLATGNGADVIGGMFGPAA